MSTLKSRLLAPLTFPVRLLTGKLLTVMPASSANELQWRARGALMAALFGALWLGVGLSAGGHVDLSSVLSVLVLSAALAAIARHLLRHAARLPRGADDPRALWIFAWTNAAQWSAIVLLAVQLHRSHLDRYDASAIAAIMALHFFVLAQLLRSWVLHVTGAAVLLWIISTLLIAPWHPASLTALGTGVILWMFTAVTLAPLILALQLAPARAAAATAGKSRCLTAARWGRAADASTEVLVIARDGLGARARLRARYAQKRPLDAEKENLYAELGVKTLPTVAREALLNADVSEPGIRRDLVPKYRAEGRQQALASLVLRLLTIRYRELADEVTPCVEAAAEEELVAVAERVLAAPTLQQALGERLAARIDALHKLRSGTSGTG